MKMNLNRREAILGGASLLSLSACGAPQRYTEALLDWRADPTYAGFIVAKALNYYSDKGLNIEFSEGSGGANAAIQIGGGKTVVGTSSGSATAIALSKGIPIKSTAVIYQTIPTVVFSLATSEIFTPQDMPGKRIGLVSGSVTVNEFQALLNAQGIDRSSIVEIGVQNDPTPLLNGDVDMLVDYYELLPAVLMSQGHELNIIRLGKFGVDMYGLNIIANQKFAESEYGRESIDQFTSASIRGYEFLRENPREALEIYAEVYPEKKRAYLQESFARVSEMLAGSEIGSQTVEGWASTISTLNDLKLLENPVGPNSIIL